MAPSGPERVRQGGHPCASRLLWPHPSSELGGHSVECTIRGSASDFQPGAPPLSSARREGERERERDLPWVCRSSEELLYRGPEGGPATSGRAGEICLDGQSLRGAGSPRWTSLYLQVHPWPSGPWGGLGAERPGGGRSTAAGPLSDGAAESRPPSRQRPGEANLWKAFFRQPAEQVMQPEAHPAAL